MAAPAATATAHFVRVAAGAITLDGRLDEPAWAQAPALTTFFEIAPRDRARPRAATTTRFLFDGKALYVGVHMDEPQPGSLRGQFVERDHVSDGQDYIEVFIDALGSGRGAQFFRTDLRGIETDGHYSETNESEDDAPDYRWRVATARTTHGWSAEFRIPFSTLRYVASGSRWRLLVYRGRPRTDSVQDASSPIPRSANCFVCFFNPVQGLAPPPPRGAWFFTPDVVVHAGAPSGGFKTDFGFTASWQPGGGRALDVTINPDFSEVEADAIQVTGNARYAQSLPEKRPFFMESLDLLAAQPDLDRPLQPVYTRDIADPDLGVRYTERATDHDFTALIARDAGGGSVLLPGPFATGEVAQTRESDDLVARYVRNLPDLALGGVVTDREYLGGGFNRVAGMDANWHPSASDNVNAEALFSATGGAPGDATGGPRRDAVAGYAKWTHLGERWTWDALLQQVGTDFRADLGFVPTTGFREFKADAGRRWFDVGRFSELRPTLGVEDTRALDSGETIVRSIYPGLTVSGPHGLWGDVELHLAEHARADAGMPLHDYKFLRMDLAEAPASWWPLASISGDVGQQLDLATGVVRPGGSLALESDFRPLDKLEFDIRLTRAWLRATAADRSPHRLLLDQRGEQVTALWHFSVADELRLQAYRERDGSALAPATQSWAGSLLFLHHTSWRSAWYVGISRNVDPALPARRGWEVLAKWTYTCSRL
ncbi:MAG: sugar-binding protein [Rhodanobacteraceae bacterium]